jgi:rubrerythrin
VEVVVSEPHPSEASRRLQSTLGAAFAAEAMSVQRYSYFAQLAEIEGHIEVARLFGELAESNACAAHGHIDVLQLTADPATGRPIGTTHLNLASAIAGELREANQGYPDLAAAALADGHTDVASWLTTLCALKKAHVDKLEKALSLLTVEMGAVAGQESRP